MDSLTSSFFKHSIDVIRGKYDDPDDEGEISHFQALTSALSATVGLGNIGGVAVAIQLGGTGAVFWLWLVAFFGMSMKFSSCSFAQLYRKVSPDGSILGGPMVYLREALQRKVEPPKSRNYSRWILCIHDYFGILWWWKSLSRKSILRAFIRTISFPGRAAMACWCCSCNLVRCCLTRWN